MERPYAALNPHAVVTRWWAQKYLTMDSPITATQPATPTSRSAESATESVNRRPYDGVDGGGPERAFSTGYPFTHECSKDQIMATSHRPCGAVLPG